MAIQYSGGTLVYTQIAADTRTLIIENLKTVLTNAGMSLSASIAAYVTVTFSGLPTDAQNLVLDGVTYVFKNTLVQATPYQVKIGADATATASNLADAINATVGTSGTAYSNTTTAHTTCSAAAVAGVVTISAKVAGTTGNGKAITKTASNVTLSAAQLQYGGYKMQTARTAQGLQCKFWFDDDVATAVVRVRIGSVDETFIGSTTVVRLVAATSRVLEVVACRYQFFIYMLGSSATNGVAVMGGVPYIRSAHVAPVITAVTNSGGLCKITTDVPHGMVTGDHVFIADATGLTSINAYWQVTVIDTVNYTLDTSTYAGGYTASSARAANATQIARAFWLTGDESGTVRQTFRVGLGSNGGASIVLAGATCLNQFALNTATGTAWIGLALPVTDNGGTAQTFNTRAWGGYYALLEPRICWTVSAIGAEMMEVGQLWNAFVVNTPVNMDVARAGYDAYNWTALTNNYARGCLFIAKTAA